jgi:DNA helicase HerA-like ATPase
MSPSNTILIGGGDDGQVSLRTGMGNRHGLIAGATGTGKTVSLQILAEGFSRAGVPVFLADVKGDLSGMAAEAQPNDKIRERVERIGINDYARCAPPSPKWVRCCCRRCCS